MTEEQRLEKNNQIREKCKQTREKRKSQVCRVYRVKIDISHLNETQKEQLKMLFVEAKWLYNDKYDTKIVTVHGLDKDKNPVLRSSVISGIKSSLKILSSLKKNNHKVGGLRYKSDYVSINLQQHKITYRFNDGKHIGLQGFSKSLKIRGAKQFWNIPDLEFANAKLLNLPDGYYIAITTYQDKGGEKKKYKPEIGIDMGIKTTITTSDGRKFKVLIEESERLKKCQRLIARRKKGSSNRYRARKLMRKSYQKSGNKKRDAANKITHELLEHAIAYMQDENLKGWHKGLFGKTVQHSVLGLVKTKLMNSERVIVLPQSMPTTKYCPECGNLKKDIKLSDRVYECPCGYHEDRDIHAARNMILLSQRTTCGTQGTLNPAFGEDVLRPSARRRQKCCNADLVELGSPSFYKRG